MTQSAFLDFSLDPADETVYVHVLHKSTPLHSFLYRLRAGALFSRGLPDEHFTAQTRQKLDAPTFDTSPIPFVDCKPITWPSGPFYSRSRAGQITRPISMNPLSALCMFSKKIRAIS
jgi:hypothetical protein